MAHIGENTFVFVLCLYCTMLSKAVIVYRKRCFFSIVQRLYVSHMNTGVSSSSSNILFSLGGQNSK